MHIIICLVYMGKRNLDRLLYQKKMNKIKLLQSELDRQKEIQDLNAEITNLRNRLDESVEEKKNLKIEIEDLNEKIAKLVEEYAL